MKNKILHPSDLRPLNYTHLKEAAGDFGEEKIAELVDACIRFPKQYSNGLIPKKAGGEKGADLQLSDTNIDCEVKMRYRTQALYVGRKQLSEMQDREKYKGVTQYYGLCFYDTDSSKRMGELNPIGKQMTEYDIRKHQLRYVDMIQIQTIFLFPLQVVLDYFIKRDSQKITRKYGGSVWSSNIGPINEYFRSLHRDDTVSFETQGFTKVKPNMKLHIVGREMIERINTVQADTGFILSSKL